MNYSYYVDIGGTLDVVGQVQNVGTSAVDPVILAGSVYGPDGSDLSDSFSKAYCQYLIPGQRAPFIMSFSPPQNSGGWAPSYIGNFSLTVVQMNATSTYLYQDLAVTSSSGHISTLTNYEGAYEVDGVIKNTGTQTAENLSLSGAFFNATGCVVGVGFSTYLTPRFLTPGNKTTFQIFSLDLNQSQVFTKYKITSYELLLEAQSPKLQGTPPTNATTDYRSTGVPSNTPTPYSSEPASKPKNPSNPTTAYIIVAAVIVAAGVAGGTLMVIRSRKPHQTVKEARKARKQSNR